MSIPASRRRLARIRCLQECIQCFREQKKFPESLCYVPSEVEYSCTGKTVIKVYGETKKSSKKIRDLVCTSNSRIYASGEEHCNSSGKWLKIKKFKPTQTSDLEEFDSDVWILLYGGKSTTEESPTVVPTDSIKKPFYEPNKKINHWEEVVEHTCSVAFPNKSLETVPPDEDAVKKLRDIPVSWTMEHDEALVRLMSHHISPENDQLGTIKNYVESIDVSSYMEEFGPSSLTDGDPDTYWESDGSQGQHWIQLRMKKGTIIKKLQITVEGSDDNYLPSRLVIQGGEADNLKTLNTISVDWEIHDTTDITVLENMTEHFPVVTIRIKECKAGGIDTRIRGIKITSTEERAHGFDRDFFKGDNLIRYPKLETYSPDELYRRSTVLQRFMTIVDSVLQYVVPTWEYSTGSYSSLEYVRQLLPLSKKRLTLIETFLKETSSEPPEMPKLYINRRAAMEHRCDPTQDPECKNSIFMQIYEGLKPRDRNNKPLNYRWSFRYDQWWECKFLLEGVIDQGGGFRDSLSDLAEELCPSSTEGPVPLPFFIRSPNQFCEDSNINRDVYIPNPSCKDFSKYEWIGQLMGACMRGRENLVLTLPSFVWKKLVGERVTWSRDYHTVDAAEVKMVDSLGAVDIEIFKAAERTWSMTLCDGSVTVIKMDEDCNPMLLKYEDRENYAVEVRKIRMIEFDDQINAIRRGLLKVVPHAVLDLLTWQELEHRICGNPEITIEALRKATHYDDVEEKDTRVKYLWEALKNFSNDDRSRFLRFVTGRRRLPAPLYISTGKGDMIDCLPESSTCANILYLPNFSSAKVAEEKIRYAAYNCMDIDTDMNLWED
ncbi:hypothetical protein CHS0354_024922 [Potamilus streckersoni]|uniref:E3 ubiquitin-protein ligase HECTD3 n=1 Tax=Potamilus streckersoni TaxID=2493646 RepID=A0AAE0S4N0_9BIVA|nr:hypothetical protein CHS0354_024922 [Potamilus streckersoni]